MASNGVRLHIRDSGKLNILRHINIDLSVGIQPEDADTPHGDGPMTIGEIATINEFGAAAINLPARKWFRGWVGAHASRVTDQLRTALAQMVRTQKFQAEPLQVLAKRAQSTMVGRIAAGQIGPKNAPSTLAKKSPETRPLVEHGQLMRSIHAKVTGRGLLRSLINYSTRGGGA